jgi:hypothetical protein
MEKGKVTMSASQEILRAGLSTRIPAGAVVTTSTRETGTSSATPARPALRPTGQPPYFRIIGRGTCGTVYEHSGLPAEVVVKVGSDRASIKRDFNHALRAFNASRTSCARSDALLHIPHPLIPRPRKLLDDHDLGRLGSRGLRLEAVDAELCVGEPAVFRRAEMPAAWEGERIGPVCAEIRGALVDMYVQPELRGLARSDGDNQDCLVRIYLGARSPPARYHLQCLRNAPLFQDHMKRLGLDTTALAEEMALGLATCHWGACLDGMDVEFVLGAPRLPTYRDRTDAGMPQPAARMWMLDYDKTALVSHHGKTDEELDEARMAERLAVAMHGNDPYYPRPSLDRGVWDRFAEVYVLASRSILRNTKMSDEKLKILLEVPSGVMARLEKLYQDEEKWHSQAEDMVGFEPRGDDGGEGWGSDEVFDGDDEDGESGE